MRVYAGSLTPTLVRPTPFQDWGKSQSTFYDSFRYVLLRVFSCWHRTLGRPFTHGGLTYRSCMCCGMRREFDLTTWKLKGRYHNAPVESLLQESSSIRKPRVRLKEV